MNVNRSVKSSDLTDLHLNHNELNLQAEYFRRIHTKGQARNCDLHLNLHFFAPLPALAQAERTQAGLRLIFRYRVIPFAGSGPD